MLIGIFFPLFPLENHLQTKKKVVIFYDLRVTPRHISGIFYTYEILLHKPSAPDWNQPVFPISDSIVLYYRYCDFRLRFFSSIFFLLFLVSFLHNKISFLLPPLLFFQTTNFRILFFRNRIISPIIPRMAFDHSPKSQPESFQDPKSFNGLIGILRTTWMKTT